MILALYRLLYVPALLVVLPWYVWLMTRRGGWRSGFRHRFGWLPKPPEKQAGVRRFWFQAVSVGELLALEPLLREMASNAAFELVVTTTTPTGYAILSSRLAPLTVSHGYFPLDALPCSWLAYQRIRPDVVILTESELWPEHIHQAARRGLPLVLLNARISDTSYRRYQRFRSWLLPFTSRLHTIFPGSPLDFQRFRQLGWIPPDRIQLPGNLKFDVQLPPRLPPAARADHLREFGFTAARGQQEPLVLLGASTWAGEERSLAEALQQLLPEFPNLRLLIVPRHQERAAAIRRDLLPLQLPLHFRSDSRCAPDGTRIYIADTTGELQRLTQLADIAFIGKSLPPHTKGQTPIEAAAYAKPLIFGPGMRSFSDLADQLRRADAVLAIDTADDLAPAIRKLLVDPGLRQRLGTAAAAVIDGHRGAAARCASLLAKL